MQVKNRVHFQDEHHHKPLLILNIDIGQGLQDTILLYREDPAHITEAALNFISRNSLDHASVIGPLL